MSSGSIQQQYYTRGRKGLFQAGEGFDTVAKSPGLDNNFIKKVLHPYCLYIAPQELARRGERDSSLYPPALTVFPVESGELVIGRSIFAGPDFSGQRDVIFTHNYVIPAARREEFLRRPGALFRITGFASTFDETAGTALPELTELTYGDGLDPKQPDALLERLGVTEALFKRLLYACFNAAVSKRKVYIALDVDVSESSARAAELLDILYRCLPYEVRQRFGFTTYNNEPQGRKNIDVMFVEKGSIRSDTRSMGKDFWFDFPNGRFPEEEDPSSADYLDFAWQNRTNPAEWEAFFDFADEALDEMPAPDKLSIATYAQAAMLYRTAQGAQERYKADKAAGAEALLRFLRVGGPDKKPRLHELLLGLLRDEARARPQALQSAEAAPTAEAGLTHRGETSRKSEFTGGLPVRALTAFMEYYAMAPDEVKPGLVADLTDLLDRSVMKEQGGQAYLRDAGVALAKQPALQKLIYERLGRELPYAELSEAVLSDRLGKVKTVKEYQEEILFWNSHSPDSLGLPYFIGQFQEKLKRTLHKSGDQAVSGEHMHKFLTSISRSGARSGLTALCQALWLEIARSVLDTLSPATSTWPEARDAGYLLMEDALLRADLSEEQTRKLRIFRAAYEAMTNQGVMAEIGADFADSIGREEDTGRSEERDGLERSSMSGETTLHSYASSLDRPLGKTSGSSSLGSSPGSRRSAATAFDFRDLLDRDITEIQQLVRRFLEGRIEQAQYPAVVFVFTDWITSTGGFDRPIFIYDMLVFVQMQTEGTDEVYDFIRYTSRAPSFTDVSGRRVRKVYKNALRKYFAEADRKALRNRKIVDKLVASGVSKDFTAFIAELRRERMNPLARLVVYHRGLSVLLLAVAVGITTLVWVLGDRDGESNPATGSPAVSPSLAPGQSPDQSSALKPWLLPTLPPGLAPTLPSEQPTGSPSASPEAE